MGISVLKPAPPKTSRQRVSPSYLTLQTKIGIVHRCPTGECFRNGRFVRCAELAGAHIFALLRTLTVSLPNVFSPRCLPDEIPCCFDTNRHIGEHEGYCLMVHDILTHCLSSAQW